MIETRLIEPDGCKEEGKLLFPLLARSSHDGEIVLFSDRKTGMVLRRVGDSSYRGTGHYSCGWAPITDACIREILPRGYGVAIIQGKVRE